MLDYGVGHMVKSNMLRLRVIGRHQAKAEAVANGLGYTWVRSHQISDIFISDLAYNPDRATFVVNKRGRVVGAHIG